jgi:primosomal protein N' (replication factor Y)
LPPFAYLALLTAEAPGREAVTAFLERAVAHGRALLAASELRCEVYSPVPAGLARRAGLERGQVLVQSSERSALHEFLPRWRALLETTRQRRVRWTIDVDPLEFA